MSNGFLSEVDGINRRVMIMYFVIDTSLSMRGSKIGAVNSAIEEMIPDLRELSESNADAEIKLAVLKFSTGCEWVTPTPISLEAFGDWEALEVDGMTDLGSACSELCAKLSQKSGFMTKETAPFGFYAPVIILLSDGGPTDSYDEELDKLKNNKWYKSALKVAIAIGKDAKKGPLEKFTENPELVIPVNNSSMLKKLIRFAAVTSSQIASSSSSVAVGGEMDSNAPTDLSDVSSANAENQIVEAISVFREEETQNIYSDNTVNDIEDDDFD